MGKEVFTDCTALTAVTMGDGAAIGISAFARCNHLTSLTFEGGISRFANDAFAYCTALTTITFHPGMTTIGGNAFAGCTALGSVTIPEGVTSIGGGAFSGCTSLIVADLPESVKSIGRDAFKQCSSLSSIKLPSNLETIDFGAFELCESLTSVVIPNGVTTVGNGAFYGCLALKIIGFPESVTSLGNQVIDYCPAMTDCYFHHTTPLNITGETFHESTRQQLTLHVPSGCKAQYATAEYWKDFKEIVDDIPTTVSVPVLTRQDAESYYDLRGNRVDKTRLPRKSIVIHHGKKYFVK